MSWGCRAPRPPGDSRSTGPVVRLPQFTGLTREGTCPSRPERLSTAKTPTRSSVSNQNSVSTPGFPSPHVGSPSAHSYSLPTHPLLPWPPPPSPMVPWVGPATFSAEGKGRAYLLAVWSNGLCMQWNPWAPTHEKCLHGVALSSAVSFLPALDWETESGPLVAAHSLLPSSLPSANIREVLVPCQAGAGCQG